MTVWARRCSVLITKFVRKSNNCNTSSHTTRWYENTVLKDWESSSNENLFSVLNCCISCKMQSISVLNMPWTSDFYGQTHWQSFGRKQRADNHITRWIYFHSFCSFQFAHRQLNWNAFYAWQPCFRHVDRTTNTWWAAKTKPWKIRQENTCAILSLTDMFCWCIVYQLKGPEENSGFCAPKTMATVCVLKSKLKSTVYYVVSNILSTVTKEQSLPSCHVYFILAEIVKRKFFAFSYFHDIAIALGLIGMSTSV